VVRRHPGSYRLHPGGVGAWCSITGSGEETGPLCTHGGGGFDNIVAADHWSCCGATDMNAGGCA